MLVAVVGIRAVVGVLVFVYGPIEVRMLVRMLVRVPRMRIVVNVYDAARMLVRQLLFHGSTSGEAVVYSALAQNLLWLADRRSGDPTDTHARIDRDPRGKHEATGIGETIHGFDRGPVAELLTMNENVVVTRGLKRAEPLREAEEAQ